MVKLQLALDVLNLEEAIRISEQIADYVDIIELGTPLIKEESAAESIMVMKKLFYDKLILADFKTMETGRIEAGIAFDAGADIMTVCGTAEDNTIRESISKARKVNRKIMVDLIGAQDKLKRALEIEKLNPDYICAHLSIGKNESSLEELKELKEKIKIPIAVAGGITGSNISSILKLDPSIIIIGRALTHAKNPINEAKMFNKLIHRKIDKSRNKNEREPFIKIMRVIENEIKSTLSKVNIKSTRKIVNLLYKNKLKNIFIAGEGRSGLIGRAFAMRLIHLGYKSYFVSESTVPEAEKKDVFISISGTGKTPVVFEMVKQARKQKAFTVLITANRKSPIAKQSKLVVEIPALTDSNTEPLGSLFEQSALLYTDMIAVALMIKFNKSPLQLRKFYPNL